MSTPIWMEDAACTTHEARALPWTTDTMEVPEVIVDLMRSTCDSCAVRSACNSYALEERVSGGMWACTDRDRALSVIDGSSAGSRVVLAEQLELPLVLADAIDEVFGGAA